MMKNVNYFILFLAIIGIESFAVNAAPEETDLAKTTENKNKTYSEKEFWDEVNKEADRRVAKIRPKNVASFSRELLRKEDELKIIEKKVEDREKQLKLNEESFAKKVMNLEVRQQKILGCIDKNENETQKRIEHVVSIVSTMRPEKAAEVLSVQDPEISVKILSQLESARASKIFNLMDKEISARLQKQYMNMKK